MDYIDSTVYAPSYASQPEIVRYTENQARFLPIMFTRSDGHKYAMIFSNNDSNVICLLGNAQSEYSVEFEKENLKTFDVNDCVTKCQNVLGLKINEIAKLAGVSRATLDLHRKGSNIKDMSSYNALYTFVSEIEALYGCKLKNSVRNVLVDKKTLVQHFIKNANKLDSTLQLISQVAEKVNDMKISSTNFESSKLSSRLGRIGKIA
ncbi:hypothetical protein FCV66_12860 [Enterovibrio norvegicus]|uniref:hypothetical protein n=1 Tax=Enterovibrio norvegicus TaxID=188144 RepID=UPI0010BE2CB5|nr:hypothetical protein [Enterovibrio norvegicus]TKF13712.1 hypothetical protein FCV66_12860 [Enterovibrio norvegicus]